MASRSRLESVGDLCVDVHAGLPERCSWLLDDDLLMEADEVNFDAVEARLMKRLEVRMQAQIGGKSSGEVGFLKRVLRNDAVTESVFWCIGTRYVQEAVATLQLEELSRKCMTTETIGIGATLRNENQELDEKRDSRIPERPGISDVRGSGKDLDPVRHQDHGIVHAIPDEVRDGQARARGATSAQFFEWVYFRQGVPKYLDVSVAAAGQVTMSGTGSLELQRSLEVIRTTLRRRRNHWPHVWRRGTGGTAGGLFDRGWLRGHCTNVERQQCFPRDRQAQALGDPANVDRCRRESSCSSLFAKMRTWRMKHLAASRGEELYQVDERTDHVVTVEPCT